MKCALCRKPTERSLCKTCWEYALDKLKVFPNKYDELSKELIPSQGRSERVGGSKTPPIPVRLETLHLRSGGISKPLMEHEESIRAEQRHTRITFRGNEINRITMTCKYLTAQSDYILAHYKDSAQLALDINKIYKRIQTVLGFKSDLVNIGTCPSQDDKGNECGANLQINPSTLTNFGDIKCRVCGAVWPSEKWRLLGRMLDADNQ